MSDLLAPRPLPPAPWPATHLTSLQGADIERIRPHWRGPGRLRSIEVELVGGDVVLVDAFALRLLAEVQARLQEARRG